MKFLTFNRNEIPHGGRNEWWCTNFTTLVARLAAGQHEAHREGGRVRNGVEMGADGFGLLSGMFPNMDSIFHIHEWIRSSLTSQTEESVSTPLSSVNKGTLNQRAFPEQRRR
jgi:hypothetical protein